MIEPLVGAVGLSEVRERRQTPSGHAAPACTAPAASGGGQVMWSRLLLLVTLVVSAVWLFRSATLSARSVRPVTDAVAKVARETQSKGLR
jgi:hypothetical protein